MAIKVVDRFTQNREVFMRIESACTHCGVRYRVAAESVGLSAKCKSCGQSFILGAAAAPSQRTDDLSESPLPDDYMTAFGAVKAALHARFGSDEGRVFHSPIPLYLDAERGLAESLTFLNYVPGFAYCTCGLSVYPDQKPGPNGNYELMMCSRERADYISNTIGSLGRYTFEAVLAPGETMDLGPAQPPGSTLRGLLCATPDMSPPTFRLFGRDCTVLLLMGITLAEMEACQEYGSDGILLKLKRENGFPYTTLDRKSVV